MKKLAHLFLAITGIVPLLHAESLASQPVAYISSSTGYVLYRQRNNAVTASWNGQKPIVGFSGYGQIKMDNLCLTGDQQGQLLWLTCRNTTGQRWGLSRGRLRNEKGWCADLQGNRSGADVPVLAWQCSGSANQRWKPHYMFNVSRSISKISNTQLRSNIQYKINTTPPGRPVPFTPQERQALRLIGLDGASLISAGGMNLISAGGMNLISPGGMWGADRK